MKLTAAAFISAALLIALAGCTQSGGQDASATAPTGAVTSTVVSAAAPTTPPTAVLPPTLAPLPTSMAAPVATPTALPIRPIEPTSLPPTVTPLPTATPPPTAAPTPVPTATPQPTPTAVPPPAESSVYNLGGGIFLSVTPGEQFAGRDVSFSLSGLPPWRSVRVSFIDPQGVAAPWVTTYDVNLLDRGGAEATSVLMYPTESGALDWVRYGIQDETGAWSVDINLDGRVSPTAFALKELRLHGQEAVSVGAELTKNSGTGSTVYYSELVPTALVIDLQNDLSETALSLEKLTGTEMGKLPDLFLMANRELMEEVGIATGVTVGFEDGYFKNFGARPGIYMRTDLKATELRRLLTHEYVHLVFDNLANRRKLPAWLTEGLSRYYEFEVALSGTRPDATQVRQFRAADAARTAAQQGSLFSLASLDSQRDWNSRTGPDQISLQYSEAYMAVRYLNETYGPLSGKKVVLEFGRGFGLPDSIKTVTGLELAAFEAEFISWLEVWEDPERASIAVYLGAMETILADQDVILDERSEDLSIRLTAAQASIRRVARLRATEALIDRLQSLSPPERELDLQQDSEEYLGKILEWLTLEFQHADTADDFYRVAANAMIPEINARDLLLQRSISNLQFFLNL